MPSNIDQIAQRYIARSGNQVRTPSQTSANNPKAVAISVDSQSVLDLIDCLQKPSAQITPEYVALVQRTASLLGSVSGGSEIFKQTGSRPSWDGSSYPEQGATGYNSKNVNSPSVAGSGADANEKIRNEVNRLRNEVYDTINIVNAFVARAKNAGFAPPENPFVLAMSFNVGRIGFSPIVVPNDVVAKIVKNIGAYVALLEAERVGKLNMNQNVNSSAQLSSAKLSLDGFGGSGDPLVDLSKLLPDADEVKAQKAIDALSVFDFSKRTPKVLFTAHYSPDGEPKGVIVGWRRVNDASGYVLKRRNAFDGSEVSYALTNADVKLQNTRLIEYVKAWVLSFYDNINPDNVCCFLDADVSPNAYYFYRLQSFQLQNNSPGSMFNVQTSPHFISQSVKLQIRAQLESLDPDRKGTRNMPDTISPWPVLAQFILGDSKYDWLLAALNIRQSINRGDTRTITRGYSYLAAQLNFLFTQADTGKLVVPKDHNVAALLKNVGDAISQFGSNQVIKEILQETGALYHFEGKDPNDNAMFTNVDSGDANESGLISTIASAIDPENAVLNLRTLASNLPKLLSGEFVNIGDSLAGKVGRNSSKAAKSSEIEIPNFDRPSDTRASDEIKFLQKLGDVGDGFVDLTTLEGVAQFMRTIRIFSDVGPNRGAPISNVTEPIVPDPVPPPAPAPAPRSASQPVQEPLVELGSTQNDIDRQATEAAQRRTAAKESRTDRNTAARDSLSNDRTGRGKGGTD